MMAEPGRKSHWQIIACDLDGTLIGWNHKINERDLEALRQARAAGIHVAICTGRNSRECAGITGVLEPDGLGVFVNGAMICGMADGRAVHSTTLPDGLANETVDFFGSRGHAVMGLVDEPATRMPEYFLTEHAPPHQATVDWLAYNRVHARTVTEIPEAFRARVVRLGVVVNVSQAAELHAVLHRRFGSRLATHSIYSPHYDCQIIEAFDPGVNKWSGLLLLAERMGVSPEHILAVGDDVNDLAMLRGAKLSFAMGDAAEEVKKAAKRICAAHAECGVAEVVGMLLRGEVED